MHQRREDTHVLFSIWLEVAVLEEEDIWRAIKISEPMTCSCHTGSADWLSSRVVCWVHRMKEEFVELYGHAVVVLACNRNQFISTCVWSYCWHVGTLPAAGHGKMPK